MLKLLYTLCSCQTNEVETGLLVYLNKNETLELTPNSADKRGMIIARNKLAHFITSDEMPPMIDNPSTCVRCYSKSECFKYHKAIENGTPSSSGSPKIFEEHAGFLTKSHILFLKRWEAAIKVEESKTQRQSRDIWAIDSKVRESLGTCVSGLRICQKSVLKGETRFKYQYHLTSNRLYSQDNNANLSGSSFVEGDPVMITRNDSKHPVAIGFLIHITGPRFEVSTDKPIDATLDQSQPSKIQTPTKAFTFTIDKDGYSTGQGLIRANLFQLFSEAVCRRRDLIVDLVPPVFGQPSAELKSVLQKYEHELNAGQTNAILKVGTCEDYALILGMPGTGKTHLVAKTIKILIETGKTILMTSYTHSAVDNVLLKLLDMGVDFVRLGTLDKVCYN
jgi:DNA replication ATP-dependent helicase Dna2